MPHEQLVTFHKCCLSFLFFKGTLLISLLLLLYVCMCKSSTLQDVVRLCTNSLHSFLCSDSTITLQDATRLMSPRVAMELGAFDIKFVALLCGDAPTTQSDMLQVLQAMFGGCLTSCEWYPSCLCEGRWLGSYVFYRDFELSSFCYNKG